MIAGADSPGGDARNLMSFITSLQGTRPEVWARTLAAIRTILPETKAEQILIRLRPGEQVADLAVAEHGIGRVAWALAPAGLKQIVFLVSAVSAAARGSLICLEEPESNLHPIAQRRLLNFLADEAREFDKQIILSTHSLEILDTPRWTAVVLLERPDKAAKRYAPRDIRKIIEEWWNVRRIARGELGKFLLFVEGQDDLAVWSRWVKKHGLANRVAVRPGGGMGVLGVGRAVKMIARLGVSAGMDFKLVLDAASPDRSVISAWFEPSEFYVCEQADITGYLLQEKAALVTALALDPAAIDATLATIASADSKHQWRALVHAAGMNDSADLKARVAEAMSSAPDELRRNVLDPLASGRLV